ncbi:hypothetical protein [Empedobacter brevis]|nr:hypothetical protein [Empedobacter brevis]
MKEKKTRKQLKTYNLNNVGRMTELSWWNSEFRSVLPKQDILNKPKYKKK